MTTSNPPLLARFEEPSTHHFLMGNELLQLLVLVGLFPFTPIGFHTCHQHQKHIYPGIQTVPASCHT